MIQKFENMWQFEVCYGFTEFFNVLCFRWSTIDEATDRPLSL